MLTHLNIVLSVVPNLVVYSLVELGPEHEARIDKAKDRARAM